MNVNPSPITRNVLIPWGKGAKASPDFLLEETRAREVARAVEVDARSHLSRAEGDSYWSPDLDPASHRVLRSHKDANHKYAVAVETDTPDLEPKKQRPVSFHYTGREGKDLTSATWNQGELSTYRQVYLRPNGSGWELQLAVNDNGTLSYTETKYPPACAEPG